MLFEGGPLCSILKVNFSAFSFHKLIRAINNGYSLDFYYLMK